MNIRGYLATVAFIAGAACAYGASATEVTGSIYFGGGFSTNGYNPADGGVPPGYSNESSNTLTIEPGTVFGFEDEYNRDTADFTGTTLVLEDTVLNAGASSWQQTFTADTPDYFTNIALAGSSFSPGLTYSVAGNTLTVDWPGEYSTGSADYSATFAISPAPEPSTWLLMITGLGAVGLMLRQAQRRTGLRLWGALAA